MKALRIYNAVALALMATFTVTFGVVCLMYAYNLDASPRVRAEWPLLLRITAIFTVAFVAAALAWWGQHRQRSWRWAAQGLQVAVLIVGALLLQRLLN